MLENPASEVLCKPEKAQLLKLLLRKATEAKFVLVIGKFNLWANNCWLSKCQLSKTANCRLGNDIHVVLSSYIIY